MKNNYLKDISLLYVEDDQNTRELLEEFLSKIVKKLYVAKDGEEGLEKFKEYKPDIVLTDIHMPKLDGISLSEYIKKLKPSVSIVINTAFTETKHMIKSIDLGIDAYVLKPLNLNKLYETLEKVAKVHGEELALKKSNNLLQEYQKVVDAGVIVSKTDTKGIITYANDQFCKISGYTREELIGSNHNIVRHPFVDPKVYKDLWATITQKKIWKGRIENRAKDGSSYYISATIAPILDEEGEIVEYIALREDITELELLTNFLEERVLAEITKRKDKEKKILETLRAIFETGPNPIIIYEADRVNYANKKFLKLVNMSIDELEGSRFKLDSIFEKRKDTISTLDEIDEESETNKVSISLEVGRNIFYLLVNHITSSDGTKLKMYTFNNITLNEYQQLKIAHYTEQLEEFFHKNNKVLYMSNNQVATEPINNGENLKRVLNDEERTVLKRSRNNVEISATDYLQSIDSYILDEIYELKDIETDLNEQLTYFSNAANMEYIHKIGELFLKYTSTVALLLEFEDFTFTINSLSNLLLNLTDQDLDQSKSKKIELYLSNILLDLSNWRLTVFVDKSAKDIHYLDSSLFSTILQFELIFNDNESIENDDDFELF